LLRSVLLKMPRKVFRLPLAEMSRGGDTTYTKHKQQSDRSST
jgi:hypothetical protein